MSINNLKPVQPGRDRPSASDHNTIVNFLQNVGRSSGVNMYVDSTGQIHTRSGPGGAAVVQVRNDTGGTLPPHAIVGLGELVGDPREQQSPAAPMLKGVTPTDSHAGKFAVLLDGAAAGDTVRAAVQGVVIVKVQVGEGESPPQFVELKNEQTGHLVGDTNGSAHVLWIESEGQDRWALVRLGDRDTSPTPFRVTGANDEGGDRESYNAKRQAAKKSSTGYGGWEDSTADTDDYTLYAPSEDLTPGSSGFEEDDIVFAVKQAVSGADAEWWIVGAGGGSLPEGMGQYKVLQLDENSEPHWDWVRAKGVV